MKKRGLKACLWWAVHLGSGADPGFFKEGVVSLRVKGKRPRAKGMGEGGGWRGLGLCLNM